MITIRVLTKVVIGVSILLVLQNCAVKRFFSAKLANQDAELWIKKKIKQDVDVAFSKELKKQKKSKVGGNSNAKDSVSVDSILCSEIHQATYYECAVEKNNILQISMTKDHNNCRMDPTSFQYLTLKKYRVTSMQHVQKYMYVFAVYLQPTSGKDTIIQNFFIGEETTRNKDSLIAFHKKVSYKDTEAVHLSFYYSKKSGAKDSVVIDKIIDSRFNKIGGSKPLVYDLRKLFGESGLLLEKIKL